MTRPAAHRARCYPELRRPVRTRDNGLAMVRLSERLRDIRDGERVGGA
jgi:hypothetical protein